MFVEMAPNTAISAFDQR